MPLSELVPDQSHIDQVRDALWNRPGAGASVMVGSGFSKAAGIPRPGVEPLPLWKDLTTEMANRLYSTSADNPLRCAQEFDTSFGRTNLHGFLQSQIRDQDFLPSDMHSRLLRLPWRDVFTTNWDTLLERTLSQVMVPAYTIVVDKDQLPLVSQPRIIKLHGSMPATFPLICTEEDYRTYPTEFAPFVNTVQQAMMESVFCLIGFSGDDPNFLHWSGWVRDNLGSAKPKIYLVGYLDLSVNKRRMLEDLNVVPVDLAHHPYAREWPDHLKYTYAIDWTLHTLEYGRPYDATKWPSLRKARKKVPLAELEPIGKTVSVLPKEEPNWDGQALPDEQLDIVRNTVSVWKHNRRMYPGWLIFPAGRERARVRMVTNNWESHILGLLPRFTTIERLNAIRELVWRREILLEPISSYIFAEAVGVLESVDCSRRTVDGIANEDAPWTDIREAWREVALTLVTAARWRFDQDMFNKRIDALDHLVNDHTDVAHRIRHEKCLWALFSMDFETLSQLVKEWNVEEDDPAWMTRKAAMLWELGFNREASELIRRAITKSRAQNPSGKDIASASRESWALWSDLTFDEDSNDEDSNALNRWAELARLRCNALMEKEDIKNEMGLRSKNDEPPDFDLGSRRSIRFTFAGTSAAEHLPAHRAIRLAEVAGLPRIAEHTDSIPVAVAADILRMAADDLASHSLELAVRLVLRSCSYDRDEVLNKVLSRVRVARIPVEVAEKLAEVCFNLIEYGLKQNWPDRARVGMEVLSRLVLRMEAQSVLVVFDKSMEYYSNRQDRTASHPWLSMSLGNLLQRSWDALPPTERMSRALDVMSAAIVGVDDFQDSAFNWHPDPGELLVKEQEQALPQRNIENENKWRDFARLLVRGLETGGQARRRAASRYISVATQNRLTESETATIISALWAEEHTPVDGLPGNTNLYDWTFLVIPELEQGKAEARFRLKWLPADLGEMEFHIPLTGDVISISIGDDQNVPGRIEDTLWNLGAALSGLQQYDRKFDLNEQERNRVVQLVEHWVDQGVESHPFPMLQNEINLSNLWAIDGLASILWEVEVPESLAGRLADKIKRLTELGIPGFQLTGSLAQILPDRSDELMSWLRRGLASGDSATVRSAMAGLGSWLRREARNEPALLHPSEDLFREIGLIIAARRWEALAPALDLAILVFDTGGEEVKELIQEYVLEGLDYLTTELDYEREQDDPDKVPLLRLRCARLAVSMARNGFLSRSVVGQWLEVAENDPLPEVRHSVGSKAVGE